MTDINKAWEKLGLKPGASLREAMEAHRDLSAVWQPDRFADNPRLQRRAAEERAALDDAFATIRAALAAEPSDRREEPVRAEGPSPAAATEPPVSVRPSLYEESLADRSSARKIPYGWITIGLTLVAMAVSLYMGTGRDSGPARSTPPTTGVSEPALPAAPAEAVTETAPAVSPPGASSGETVQAAPPETPKPPPSAQLRQDRPRPAERGELPARVETAARTAVPPPAAGPFTPPASPPAQTPVTAAAPAADSPAGKAFEVLRGQSSLVDRLAAEGRFGNLEFVEWKPVRSQPPEIYIDVVARREGQVLHYIWAVDVERKTIRPLSQAARELDTGVRPKLERPS